ncbi:17730_t:CDS:2, partial [Cetraspora pellucida]
MKKTFNLAIKTRHAEKLYELHQQFIEEIKKELNMQQGYIVQSNIENNFYETINNLFAYKKVFKKTANMQHNKKISFIASNESTDIDNANRQKTVMLNNYSAKSHNVILQNQEQGQGSKVVINNENTLQSTSQDI